MLSNLGPNALIAFYNPEDGKCAVQVVTWQRADTGAIGATRSRVTLNPEQQMNIDSIEDSLTLQCGKNASSIMLVPPAVSASFGTAKKLLPLLSPPWSVEQIPGGYKVKDANGQSIAYVYGRETGRPCSRQALQQAR